MSREALMRRCAALVLYAAATSCGGGNDNPVGNRTPNPPAEVRIVSGNQQQGVAGTELPQPLVVKVLDAQGQSVAGQAVSFVVTSGGGHVVAGSGASDASGVVQERWTLGTSTAVAQKLEARAVASSTGATIVFGSFTATAVADVPHEVVVSAGDGQTAPVGTPATDSLTAKVLDKHGNPVVGATVQWTVAVGSGSVSPTSVASDAAGLAKTRLTLGTQPGSNTVTATVAGVPPLVFAATAVAGAPATLVMVSGDAQTASVGAYLADPLTVRVLDQFGNPVASATVTWTPSAGSGSLDPAATTTNADGLSSTRWALGEHPGAASASASVAGVPGVPFSATATTGPAALVVKQAGDGQSGNVGSAVADSLVVKVTDAYANPVAGATVHWTATTAGTRVDPTDVATDAQGLARTKLTLSGTSGANAVTATVSGLPPVSFAATGVAGSATTLEVFGPSYMTATVGDTVTVRVRALDALGNGVGGVKVGWGVSDGSFFSRDTTITGPDGVASGEWRMRVQAGPQNATAGLANGARVTLTVHTTPGPAYWLQKVSGDGQSAQAPATLPESLVVEAMDEHGNAVPGASVSWDGGSTGTISPPNTVTDARGLASAQWSITQPGQAIATARESSSGKSTTFAAAGTPIGGPTLTIVSGNGQTGFGLEPLSQPLVVQLNDANGQPIAGAPMTWSPGKLDYDFFASSFTDSTGKASAWGKLPIDSGQLTVWAQSGAVGPAVFSATALAGPWCSTHVVLDGPSTAAPGGTVTLWFWATDWGGNPASGATLGNRLTVSDGGTVTWRDSIPGLQIGTWTLGSKVGTQTLSYRYTFCGGYSPRTGWPRWGSAYDVVYMKVVAPLP